jgi:hypothetical protein
MIILIGGLDDFRDIISDDSCYFIILVNNRLRLSFCLFDNWLERSFHLEWIEWRRIKSIETYDTNIHSSSSVIVCNSKTWLLTILNRWIMLHECTNSTTWLFKRNLVGFGYKNPISSYDEYGLEEPYASLAWLWQLIVLDSVKVLTQRLSFWGQACWLPSPVESPLIRCKWLLRKGLLWCVEK